jgi:CRISPR-associated endonuclease Csn1
MKKFYLGMDIGTESVGMACTDEQYNLLRAKGKDLWAVRLFDEAKDAQERRAKRTARRRLQRRRQRIEWLQGIFAPFMEDDKFFLRLNNSGFYEEDKNAELKTKFSLFADEGYTDKEFYKEYPTIFHLRRDLITGTDKKVDLRHYYLALHHIVKYRGHFLFEGEDMGDIRDIKKLFQNFNALLSEYGIGLDLYFSEAKAEEFKNLALSRKGKNDKKKQLVIELFKNSTKKDENNRHISWQYREFIDNYWSLKWIPKRGSGNRTDEYRFLQEMLQSNNEPHDKKFITIPNIDKEKMHKEIDELKQRLNTK